MSSGLMDDLTFPLKLIYQQKTPVFFCFSITKKSQNDGLEYHDITDVWIAPL